MTARPSGPPGGKAIPPAGDNFAGLMAANRRRAGTGKLSAEHIRAAMSVLEHQGVDVPAELTEAARVRSEYQDDSIAELAARASCTKDVMVGRLRRLLTVAGRAERAPSGLRASSV